MLSGDATQSDFDEGQSFPEYVEFEFESIDFYDAGY
jgi:hypothetical protein